MLLTAYSPFTNRLSTFSESYAPVWITGKSAKPSVFFQNAVSDRLLLTTRFYEICKREEPVWKTVHKHVENPMNMHLLCRFYAKTTGYEQKSEPLVGYLQQVPRLLVTGWKQTSDLSAPRFQPVSTFREAKRMNFRPVFRLFFL